MKKRLIVCMLLALVLVFVTTATSFASVSSASVGANRLSNTSGKVSCNATFNGQAKTCSAKIVLQEKYNGSWRTATGVPVTTVIKNKTNTYTISLVYTFTLVKGKVYRGKVTFTDTRGTTTSTSTYYTSSF